jgi:hypothetical protein
MRTKASSTPLVTAQPERGPALLPVIGREPINGLYSDQRKEQKAAFVRRSGIGASRPFCDTPTWPGTI